MVRSCDICDRLTDDFLARSDGIWCWGCWEYRELYTPVILRRKIKEKLENEKSDTRN